MKAISLHQPWASAVAIGLKKYETRSRLTHVRGRIAIHAAKRRTFDQRCMWDDFMHVDEIWLAFLYGATLRDFDSLPFGAIIATAELVDCFPTDTLGKNFSQTEIILGSYDPGRFAWKFENVHHLAEPIPFKAHQGWFEVPDSLLP